MIATCKFHFSLCFASIKPDLLLVEIVHMSFNASIIGSILTFALYLAKMSVLVALSVAYISIALSFAFENPRFFTDIEGLQVS